MSRLELQLVVTRRPRGELVHILAHVVVFLIVMRLPDKFCVSDQLDCLLN